MNRDTIYMIFGDSISFGLYDEEQFGWVNRIRKKISFKGNYFFNMSIPGQGSSNIVKRFAEEMDNRFNKIDIFHIIFAFGINDYKLYEKDSSHIFQFEKNVKELIHQAKKYTSNIYFIGLPYVDLEKRMYQQDKLEEIDQIIRNICQKNNISYIDITNIYKKEDLVDGLHPNQEGHKKLATFLYKNLFQKIENNIENK